MPAADQTDRPPPTPPASPASHAPTPLGLPLSGCAADDTRRFIPFLLSQLGWTEWAAGADGDVGLEVMDEKREGIYNFFQVPWNLEPLMLFGYVACLDSFLNLVTILPVRVGGAIVSLLCRRALSPVQSCDLSRAVLITLVSLIMLNVDMSQAYHSIRGQAVIKLYVVFNVLEIFDKLCASFGQDLLEILYSAVRRKRRWRGGLLLDFTIALMYITLHTFVLFYHSVALNVAINSHSNILITLLISNNFVELKSNVFKKCEQENLFQVLCSDVVERFQLSTYLLLTCIQFFSEQGHELTSEWASTWKLRELLYAISMIFGSEFIIDWIKHAFVIKFNRISPAVYDRFMSILCVDMQQALASSSSLQLKRAGGAMPHEHSTSVSSRMGFVPIPLFCLVVRVVGHDVWPLLNARLPSGWLICLLAWLVAFALKLLTSVTLLGVACERAKQFSSDPQSAPAGGKPFLDGIARYTLHGKRIM